MIDDQLFSLEINVHFVMWVSFFFILGEVIPSVVSTVSTGQWSYETSLSVLDDVKFIISLSIFISIYSQTLET